MCDMLLRSLMFVPGHNAKLLASASRSDADVLLLDIEDSVQPQANKAKARELIVDRLQNGTFKGFKVFPRINDRLSGELLKDLLTLTIEGVDGFMYPKSFCARDIDFIDKTLEMIEVEKGLEVGKFKLIPLIETASAVLNAQEICQASSRVVAIAYGSEDFVSDLQGVHDVNHHSLFTPRALIAMAARASGVLPIDTVHINVHDLADLRLNLDTAKTLGFAGMLVLHPKELPIVHEYFSPSAEEVENAKDILNLYDKAKANNKGVALIEGKFIGPPMVSAAKTVLKKHNLIRAKRNDE